MHDLKQANRACNIEFNQILLNLGFKRSRNDPCAYYIFMDGYIIIIIVTEGNETEVMITLHQSKYIRELLQDYKMDN